MCVCVCVRARTMYMWCMFQAILLRIIIVNVHHSKWRVFGVTSRTPLPPLCSKKDVCTSTRIARILTPTTICCCRRHTSLWLGAASQVSGHLLSVPLGFPEPEPHRCSVPQINKRRSGQSLVEDWTFVEGVCVLGG